MNVANTIADGLETIHYICQVWAQQYGGVSFIAADAQHMWEQAFQKTDVPRIICVWIGDEMRGDFSVAAAMGRVDRTWNVAFTRGRSFSFNRNGLTQAVQNAKPFYTLVEELRDQLRSISSISSEAPIDFRSVRAMQLGEQLVDGYLYEFSTTHDYPELLLNPFDPNSRVT